MIIHDLNVSRPAGRPAKADPKLVVDADANTYHVERNGQGWSCYGGIERFELYRDGVRQAAGALLGGVTAMEISFVVDDEEYRRMNDFLHRIFDGANCLVAP